jgi:next-to-BRCA1 protein 1
VFKPGEDFVKTWKVANTGTCKWEYQYEIVLLSGNAFNGKTTKLNRVVTVGDWSEISVGMGAPKNPGDYTSYWRMADPNGNMFGASLAVSFSVILNPTKTPVPATQTQAATSTIAPTPTNTPTETPTP